MSLYYLAYGSNLHPGRLQDRVASAALLGTVEMHGWSLGFDKRSVDGSAKCNLAPGGAADIAHAAIFSLHRNDRSALDRAEGLGAGYLEARLTLELGGRELQAFYYVADPDYLNTRLRPFHWYRALVMAGRMASCAARRR